MLIYGNNIFHQQVNRHGAMVGAPFHFVYLQGHWIESGCGYTIFSVTLRSDTLAYEFRHFQPAWRRGSARGS